MKPCPASRRRPSGLAAALAGALLAALPSAGLAAEPVDIELVLALLRVWVARAREGSQTIAVEAAE